MLREPLEMKLEERAKRKKLLKFYTVQKTLLTDAIAGKMTESNIVVSGRSSSSNCISWILCKMPDLAEENVSDTYWSSYSSNWECKWDCSWEITAVGLPCGFSIVPEGICRTVLCWNCDFWEADGGRGGSSPLVVIDGLLDNVKTRREGDRGCSLDCCGEPSFSHVKGGPDIRIEFWDRPTVLRPPWRTVPKSHKSSGSPFSGLTSKSK